MKYLLIVILALSVVSANILSAEEETDKSEVSAEEKQAKEADDESGLEEFVPSEEISIDKPVAFPVDI